MSGARVWRGRAAAHPWAASAVATVAAFLAIELAFRVAGIPSFRPEDLITELDPYRITRNRANLRLRGKVWGGSVATNRLGFRGKEIEVSKPAGLYRAVALGDSCTFGACVGDDDTFCARAEALLNAERRAGVPRFEVVNAGVIGYGSCQGLATLRRAVLILQPDCIVVSFAMNDATEGGSLRDFLGRRRPAAETAAPAIVDLRNAMWNHSAIARWALRDALAPLWLSRLVKLRAGAEAMGWKPGETDDYRRNLEDIVAEARNRGVSVVFLPMAPRLKHTIYPLVDLESAVSSRNAAGKAVKRMEREISGGRDRGANSALWFAIARLKEGMGDARGALEAYLTAMSLADPRKDFRWGAYELDGIMAEAAARARAPIVNAMPELYRRELTDCPPDLFSDPYHPGPLGHRIIADALAGAIRDLARRAPGHAEGSIIRP